MARPESSLRIGLLIYGGMETVSGGYLYNRKLVDHLRSRGDRVEIISLPHGSYLRHLVGNFSKSLLKRLADADMDILIQDELAHPSLALLNKSLCRRAAFPVVTLVHLLTAFDQHPFYHAWLRRLVERKYLRSVNGMIANSHTTLAQAKRLLNGAVPPHCIAVPAGDNFNSASIDTDAVRKRMTEPGPLKILVVGNIIRRKGLHVLLHALQQLPAGNYRVTVAGRTDMEPAYVRGIGKLLRRQRLRDSVTLKGPVVGKELEQLYREHHLMVLPSAFEGYGIVYVEAQQFGLPVIGTTAGAAGEIITHGVNGYLIAPEDSRALAGHLRALHTDRSLLPALSDNAVAAYARHPTWEQSCALVRRFLYEQVRQAGACP